MVTKKHEVRRSLNVCGKDFWHITDEARLWDFSISVFRPAELATHLLQVADELATKTGVPGVPITVARSPRSCGFPHDPQPRISPPTIYQWIYTHDHRRPWERCLRDFPPRKRHRSKVPKAVIIENRPAEVERRERLGDWEGDTIVGAGRSGAVVSLVERKSGSFQRGDATIRRNRAIFEQPAAVFRAKAACDGPGSPIPANPLAGPA